MRVSQYHHHDHDHWKSKLVVTFRGGNCLYRFVSFVSEYAGLDTVSLLPVLIIINVIFFRLMLEENLSLD
jgi:hypothetical protein